MCVQIQLCVLYIYTVYTLGSMMDEKYVKLVFLKGETEILL